MKLMSSPVFLAPLVALVPACPAVAQTLLAGYIVRSGLGGWPTLYPEQFVELSVGPSTVAGLRPNGSAFYWLSGAGPTVDPGPFIEVIAGGADSSDERVFAIRTDGNVVGLHNPPITPPPAGPFADGVASGSGVILRRPDGTLASWGTCGACQGLPTGPFIAIEAGGTVGIGIQPDGTLEMWGPNTFGLPDPPVDTFTAVSVEYANSRYAYGMRTGGTIVGWGNPVPPAPPPGLFKAIDAGHEYIPNFQPWGIGVGVNGGVSTWGIPPASAVFTPPGKHNDVGTGFGVAYALVGCNADCNGVGGLTIADFGCFRTLWNSGSPAADCNGSGAFNIADFACFQTQFVAGCP